MRIMDKSKLNVVKKLDGTVEMGYNYTDNNPMTEFNWGNYDLVNVKTREQVRFKDLVLFADKDEVFLYPPKLKSTRKKMEEYYIFNWIFLDDVRAEQILNNAIQNEKAAEEAKTWENPLFVDKTRMQEEIAALREFNNELVNIIRRNADYNTRTKYQVEDRLNQLESKFGQFYKK